MLKELTPRTIIVLVFAVLAFLADARVALRGNDEMALPESLAQARALITEHKQEGNILVHSPLLSMRELAHLGELLTGPDLPEARLLNSRRILLLDVKSQPMHGFAKPSQTFEIPGPRPLLLKIFEPSRDANVQMFDLYTDLERANMHIERPAGRVVSSCTISRSQGGRSCPGQADWLYLGRRELVIGGKARSCVWAHPTTGGVVVIDFSAPPTSVPGRNLWLKVSAGLVDEAVRGTAGGAHVDTTIQQNNQIIGRIRTPNRVGLYEKEIRIEAKQRISLRITSPKDGRRHHCVNAQIEERDG